MAAVAAYFLASPIKLDLLPSIDRWTSRDPLVMRVYDDGDLNALMQGKPAAPQSYSVYVPKSSSEFTGRMILRTDNGEDDLKKIQYIEGFRRDNSMAFTSRSLREQNTGLGVFFGGLQKSSGLYIGKRFSLVEIPESKDKCEMAGQWAIVGESRRMHTFADSMLEFYRKNSDAAITFGFPPTTRDLARTNVYPSMQGGATSKKCSVNYN